MQKILACVSRLFSVGLLLLSISIPSLTMLLLAPQIASAETLSGSGTSDHPYLITTCQELQSLNNDEDANQGVVYALSGNIDCSMTSPDDPGFSDTGPWANGQGFLPIDGFNGTLDGKGHTIIGLYENRPGDAGLFENAPPLITNLHLDNTSHIYGATSTGSIAVNSDNAGLVGVSSAAEVISTYGPVGGMVGVSSGGSQERMKSTSFTGTVTNSSMNSQAGGLIGRQYGGFDISDSYVNAEIAGGYAGGLIGDSGYSGFCLSRVLANTYATGQIDTANSGYAGGLFGIYDGSCSSTKQIIHTFSTMANGLTGGVPLEGIIGSNSTNVQVADTYFNSDLSGTTDCLVSSSGSPDISTCTAFTNTSYLKNNTTDPPYASESQQFWDFDTVWQTTTDYPTLRSVGQFTGPDAPTNLVLTPQAGGKLQINWTDAENGGSSPIDFYRLQVKRSDGTWDDTIYNDTISSGSDTIVISTDTTATSMDVRVQTITDYSSSEWLTGTASTLAGAVHNISSCDELEAIDDDPNYANNLDTYRLTQDIDCSAVAHFTPIGSDSNGWDGQQFRGTFDGQGHTISGINIDSGDDYAGLFRTLYHATIRNLKLADGTIQGGYEVGALTGECDDSNLTNVSSSINVSGNEYVGGLIGYAEAYHNSITYSGVSSTGSVQGTGEVGGLIAELDAYNERTATVNQAYATGSVAATDGGDAGGLIGYLFSENDDGSGNTSSHIYLNNAYATGDVVASSSDAGGLIGLAMVYTNDFGKNAMLSIANAYATGSTESYSNSGGLIGTLATIPAYAEIDISNSFAAGAASNNAEENTSFGLIGSVDWTIFSYGKLKLDNDYVDRDQTNQPYAYNPDSSLADGMELDNGGVTLKNGEGSEPDYFKGNSSQQPMASWDFDNIWKVNQAAYPTFVPITDTDQDGIPDSVENNGPNNGDANNDGIPDSQQADVTSMINSVTGKYVVLQSDCDDQGSISVSTESSTHIDAGFDYSAGLLGFTLVGCTSPANVTQYYYGTYDASKLVARKYNAATGTYTSIPGATLSNVTIGGQAVLKVSYPITDNGPLDENQANGTITDPSGPGSSIGVPNTGFGV